MSQTLLKKTPKLHVTNRLRKEYDKYATEGKNLLRKKMNIRAGWSDSTFMRKVNNPDQITPIEREEIARVFARNVKTLFPKQ